jgi:hypothetical protein
MNADIQKSLYKENAELKARLREYQVLVGKLINVSDMPPMALELIQAHQNKAKVMK